MVIIGISPSHDGTLSVVRDGVHIFSIAEERLNRIKAYNGFPFRSLRYIVEHGIVTPTEVDGVAISMGLLKKEWARSVAFSFTEDKDYYDPMNEKPGKDWYVNDTEWKTITTDDACQQYVEKKLRRLFDAVGIHAPIEFFDHHKCHIAAAYYASGKDEVLGITLDGEGDLKSGTVNICLNGSIETLHSLPRTASLGWLYSEMTRYCGFKVARHEGKITGLAALGNPEQGWSRLKNKILVKNGTIVYPTFALWRRLLDRMLMKFRIIPYANNPWRTIINSISDLPQEDMAAAVQRALEVRATEFISYWINKTGITDLVLGGGIFANVKLNQCIAQMPRVTSLFVFPDMGDGGNAYGAAMLAYELRGAFDPRASSMSHVYLGPEYTNEQIEAALADEPLIEFKRSHNIAEETAGLIAAQKIVGWFQGRMEYGPRSLGNRSILAHPTDPSMNKWLNDRMKRTEFMPFAPSCLYEAADELFYIEKEMMKRPAEFMTITFAMKESWITEAPAVAHVDGTARPQLVRKDSNPRFHALLLAYKAKTGLPLVINTSFNVHEEPIVCRPQEAIRSLTGGVIDVLCIGDYIASKKLK